MPITLLYGPDQRFRRRYRDLTLIGNVAAPLPLRQSTYRLNDSPPLPFYVEHVDEPNVDWRFAYKNSPARLRLKDLGDFNLEIPVGSTDLRPGPNTATIQVEDAAGQLHRTAVWFDWDPVPPSLPLDLTDLSGFAHVQQVGQVVNGAFDLERDANVIRSRAPVRPDALLILGPAHGSQEATYEIRFSDLESGKYLGLSDFFVGHEENDPPLGIKPGWSTAGLATLTYGWRPGSPPEVGHPAPEPRDPASGRPLGQCRAWLAAGDNARRAGRWLVKTDPPAYVPIEPATWYRVRHQVLFEGGITRARFKLWPADLNEPAAWLCDENDAAVDPSLPRFTQASFALFQHTGPSTEWRNLRMTGVD